MILLIHKAALTLVCSLISAGLTALIIWGIKEYIKWYKEKKKIGDDPEYRFNEFPWLAFFAGSIEVLLYSSSMLDGKPEFIFIWLGVKTALKWDRSVKKKKEVETDKERIELEVTQRATYLTYLIGTGLNIILAYVSYRFVEATVNCL